jgi:hypothetical protein
MHDIFWYFDSILTGPFIYLYYRSKLNIYLGEWPSSTGQAGEGISRANTRIIIKACAQDVLRLRS